MSCSIDIPGTLCIDIEYYKYWQLLDNYGNKMTLKWCKIHTFYFWQESVNFTLLSVPILLHVIKKLYGFGTILLITSHREQYFIDSWRRPALGVICNVYLMAEMITCSHVTIWQLFMITSTATANSTYQLRRLISWWSVEYCSHLMQIRRKNNKIVVYNMNKKSGPTK